MDEVKVKFLAWRSSRLASQSAGLWLARAALLQTRRPRPSPLSDYVGETTAEHIRQPGEGILRICVACLW